MWLLFGNRGPRTEAGDQWTVPEVRLSACVAGRSRQTVSSPYCSSVNSCCEQMLFRNVIVLVFTALASSFLWWRSRFKICRRLSITHKTVGIGLSRLRLGAEVIPGPAGHPHNGLLCSFLCTWWGGGGAERSFRPQEKTERRPCRGVEFSLCYLV